MSADDIRKIRRVITDLDVKVQTLADSVDSVVKGDASRGSQANDQYVAFTNSIQATMAGSISSSVDSVKAQLVEDIRAYVDSKVAQAIQQQQSHVDQQIANALAQVNHQIAQALIQQDTSAPH